MPYAAVLDANVLHPHITMDVLLRLVDRGLFRAVWSQEILDEVYESLVRPGLDAGRIRHRIDMMKRELLDALEQHAPEFTQMARQELVG